MTIQQLAFLIAVSEYRQFTAAANELYISQSSLSKQIIALEKELGIKLFVRDTRNVYLTPAGEEILEYARRVVDEHMEMRHKLSASYDLSHAQVRIGAVPILNHYGITEQLLRFRSEHSDVAVKISETVTADIFDMLDSQKIDIGIIRTAYLKDNCYDVFPLLQAEHALLVSSLHPLADRREVGLEQMEGDRFMLMDTDPYYTRFYRRLLQDAGIHPEIEYTKMRLETIKMHVMENTCVSLMMGRVADYHNTPGTRTLRIKSHPSLYLALATKKDREPSLAVQMLREFLIQHVK